MQHLLRFTNTVLKIMKMWDQQHYPNVYAVLTHSQWVSSQFYQWRSASIPGS